MKDHEDPTPDQQQAIPHTGRLGRLADAVEGSAGGDALREVFRDVDEFTSTSSAARKAAWLRGAMQRLDDLLGEALAREVMASCGRECCGAGLAERAAEMMRAAGSLPGLIERLNANGIGGGRLVLADEHTITGGYDHCYCSQVKGTREPFASATYCHCSAGWFGRLFESALGGPVEVELVQSIITGAESCEFVIRV
jgi:hypothetical protein